MNINLKFNASKVDEIEQARKLPIENCIADTSVASLVMFIQKGLIDENGGHGVTRATAMETIDNYLAERDKDDLVMDIMEALVNAGFLSREVNIEQLRKTKSRAIKDAMKEINN